MNDFQRRKEQMGTASNGKKENILTSWKEIAAYLDRDVRTCVRWEQRYGLPVHRLDRDSKGKVFAYRDQIDAWLASRAAGGAVQANAAAKRSRWPWIIGGLLALAGLGAAVVLLILHGSSVPSRFDISGSRLLGLNEKGRELWLFDTKAADLETRDSYGGHFQEKRLGGAYDAVWPWIMFRDVDGDGRVETLFSVQTRSEDGEGDLVCIDDKGVERWRFGAGRELEVGTTFHIYLPASSAPLPASSAELRNAKVLPRGQETVLVVEDEASVRIGIVTTLGKLGYQVYSAPSGPEALRIWQLHKHNISLVLTDMVLPEGMTGLELANRISTDRPGVKIIIASGYSAELAELGNPSAMGYTYLSKPFEMSDLAVLIRKRLQ